MDTLIAHADAIMGKITRASKKKKCKIMFCFSFMKDPEILILSNTVLIQNVADIPGEKGAWDITAHERINLEKDIVDAGFLCESAIRETWGWVTPRIQITFSTWNSGRTITLDTGIVGGKTYANNDWKDAKNIKTGVVRYVRALQKVSVLTEQDPFIKPDSLSCWGSAIVEGFSGPAQTVNVLEAGSLIQAEIMAMASFKPAEELDDIYSRIERSRTKQDIINILKEFSNKNTILFRMEEVKKTSTF